ncbi:hypothetical protein MLOOGBEN_18435 [Bacillus sp. EB106-08-02-XG196]|uniref:DUF7852 domain-containing protein n=1 Tax=Bacillus sp. EB106-08-02-XG196 TaxID=2737049 RepID=UPI0015C4611D|nr:hypothetical protein [Bacillus sp. EB106-08-02-XG196]NWQ42683.1 hypothetical protein [Bacillus sp. EB106-08-02-XG196]
MKTPWTNKKKMEELISKQTNTFMRFPIKPIVLECVGEIEEDIERPSKQEKQSKQTGDSKTNKNRKKKNEPVKDEKRNNPIEESKINQNDGTINAKINHPASSKKNLNFQRVKLSSFEKPLSNGKEIDPDCETNLQSKANYQMSFMKEIKYSKTTNKNIYNISEQISPFEENVVTEANEEQTPFSEENVMVTLEEKPSSPQLVVTAEEDIGEYTPIQENEPMYADEEYPPSSEETVMTAIEGDSSTSHQIKATPKAVLEEKSNIDNEPMAAYEEQPPSPKENILTAMEENPSSFQQRKVTAEATFVEHPPIETIVEMGYDQTNPALSEESCQEHTLHVGTVREKERELTILLTSDTVKTHLEDQESQRKSNYHKEEQLTFSKDLFGINDLKRNNMNTDTDFLNIQIPVILGKYNIEICLEDEEIFAEKVKEIREISKKVIVTTCEFIPSELSPLLDNGSCKALKGNLMIEGFIQQDIKYIFENQQTSKYVQNQSAFNQMNQKKSMYLRKLNFGRYSYVPQTYSTNSPNPAQTNHGQYSERLINSMSKKIPFSSIVKINHFLHPPLFGSIEEKSFIFQNNLDQQISTADPTQFIKTTYYPENTHGKLIYSKIHENINIFKQEEKYIKTPRIKLKQFIVLELGIHLLQEQPVQVQMLKNWI